MKRQQRIKSVSMGVLEKAWTVMCFRCGLRSWFVVPSGLKSEAQKELRKDGWRLTQEYGWICFKCRMHHKRKRGTKPQP